MADIAEIKRWCEEARGLLDRVGKDSRGTMQERSADVAKLLLKLQAVPELAGDYARMKADYERIALAAKQAAEAGDKAKVIVASHDLSVLKNELRIKLADAPLPGKDVLKDKTKAEKSLGNSEKQVWAEDKSDREKDRLQVLADAVLNDPLMSQVPALANPQEMLAAGLEAARTGVRQALKDRDTRVEGDMATARGLLPGVQQAIQAAEAAAVIRIEKDRLQVLADAVLNDPLMSRVPALANPQEMLAAGVEAARTLVKQALKDRDTRVEGDMAKARGLLPGVQQALTAADAAAEIRLEAALDLLINQVKAALLALNSHLQKAHVNAKIQAAKNLLAEAEQAKTEKKYAQAETKLGDAKAACDLAKAWADQFNAYRIARVPAAAVLAAMKGRYGTPATWDGFNAKLTQADLDANVATRKYAEAKVAVESIKTDMGATLKSWTQADIKKRIDTLVTGLLPDFIAADIQQLRDWHASVPAKIAGGEWALMSVLTTRAQRVQVMGTDKVTRRTAYDKARKKASDAVDLLKPNSAMAAQVQAFELLLTGTADPLATAQAMRFEEGVAVCDKVFKDCEALTAVAAASKKFLEDKAALDKRITALLLLPAAAQMQDAVKSVQGLQSEAQTRVTGDKPDWAGGQECLNRLQLELAAAEALALSLAGVIGLQETAKNASKPEDITQAVESLRAEALKLDVEPFKTALAEDLKGIADATALALTKNTESTLEQARQALSVAAGHLLKAQNAKTLQLTFDEALAALLKRQDTVAKQAETGAFVAVKPKVVLIQPEVDKAKEAAKVKSYGAASSAIAAGNAAAQVAEAAVASITAYELAADPLAKRAAKLKTEGQVVAPIEKLLGDAGLAAAALRFDDARKLQKEAEARMEALTIKALAKTAPGGGDLMDSATKLLDLPGGDKLLDEMVLNSLNDEADFDLIVKLAEKRFGIALSSDEMDKTLSAKAIWEMMALVPPMHAVRNPSMKTVVREKPTDSGGSHNVVTKTVKMNGRPNDGGVEKFDKATRINALGLPPDYDPTTDPYAPKDETPGNLFNLTMLHEVGHAVDDRLGFMASKAGQAAFGGWQQYSDLKPIADKVADDKKYDKDYVLQRLNGQVPEPAVMPGDYAGGAVEWKKAQQAVDQWYDWAKNGKLWWDYGKSKKAAIKGVVYQEAYANRWVSYVLAERAKGITAYQWRAPGEWFAELYMSWYGKKLKDNHPFKSWLSTV